jgi:hypothetical protein
MTALRADTDTDTAAADTDAAADIAELAGRVRRLSDVSDLRDLVDRYLRSLDDGHFDDAWARSLFTADAVLTFPVGSHRGRDGLAQFTDGIMRRWARTLHHGSTCSAEVTGDDAAVTWNLFASHVHAGSPPPPAPSDVFHLGGVFTAAAVRTVEGWRFRRLSLRITWAAGAAAGGVPPIDPRTVDG